MRRFAMPLRFIVLTVLSLLIAACDSVDDAPLARVVTHGDSARREIALTFDAGVFGSTDPESAAEILRVLREHGVRATFSLTGLWAETNRDLLFTIAADGHQIINGTYAGEPWVPVTGGTAPMPASQRKLALSRTEVTVYRYTSRSTIPYARPPGEIDDSVRRDAAENGYDTIVRASIPIGTLGYRIEGAAEYARIAQPGAIMALGITESVATALPDILDSLAEARLTPLTIDDILAP
jgi:peptidoglycan/xylan/chitin deacetylase (PgdA/CDA1 family)